MRGATRYRRRAKHLTREIGGASARRRHRDRDLQPPAVRRSHLLRDVRARYREGAHGRGEVARPLSRWLRRVLHERPDRRGGLSRPHLPDAESLRVDAAAAPCGAARRDYDLGTTDAVSECETTSFLAAS